MSGYTKVGNLKGPKGDPGTAGSNGTNGSNGQRGSLITSGNGAPTATTGLVVGDTYIDLTSGDLYQVTS